MAPRELLFSAPDWCFLKSMKPDEYYPRLAEIGVDAVEMVDPPRRAAAKAAGLPILNYAAPGMTKGLNDRRNHAELLPGIRATIEDAEQSGIGHVIIFSGNRVDGIEDGIEASAEAIEQVLPDAEKAGVVLVFEMLNSFDHGGYEADNSAYGFDLAERFDSPNMKVLLDLYHMHRMGEDPAALIRKRAKHIAHLHIAGSPKRDLPGPGQDLDYKACLKAAAEIGYSGYWGMEFCPTGDAIDELAEAISIFKSEGIRI
ncbi:MAG: TIM barrel protein [Planctomycetes bacterium]|nr:TIM barrel protein [Planctomycetota bacterium]